MTNLLDDLRAADPCRDAAPDARRLDAALDELLAREIDSSPKSPLRRRLVLVLAASAAAIAATGTLLTGGGAVAPATPSAILADLAARAEAATPAGTGRYAYRRSVSYTSHMRPGYVVVLPHENEEWIARDGTGVIRSRIRDDQPVFPTPGDRTGYERDDAPRPPYPDEPFAIRGGRRVADFTTRELERLPTDPEALGKVLQHQRPGLPGDQDVIVRSALLLSAAETPTPVRHALYDVLRSQPGARVDQDAADPRGRTGVAVTFETAAWHTTFLFDRSTGELLATRSAGQAEVPGREIVDWTLVLEIGRRDEAPRASITPRVRPAGG